MQTYASLLLDVCSFVRCKKHPEFLKIRICKNSSEINSSIVRFFVLQTFTNYQYSMPLFSLLFPYSLVFPYFLKSLKQLTTIDYK